jgi:hypothetical protein
MHNNVITGLNFAVIECGTGGWSHHPSRRFAGNLHALRALSDAFACAESDVGDMRFVGRISVSVIRHRKEAVGYGFRLTHP